MICCDLHVHPDYSVDASSSIWEYCHRAEEIGLAVIGFTTHYDMNPTRADIDPFMVIDGKRVKVDDSCLERYLEECCLANERHSGVKVLAGLEVDYYDGAEEEVSRLKSKFDFDYLIGSVHCLDDIAFTSKSEEAAYYSNHSMEEMADDYYESLLQLAGCGLFDVIGHADYYIRYGYDHYGPAIYDLFKSRLAPVIKAANESQTGFEVNASQYRHGNNSFFPSIDFLKMVVENDGTVNSIGTDSHHVSSLGQSINSTLVLLKKQSIHVKFFYENQKA